MTHENDQEWDDKEESVRFIEAAEHLQPDDSAERFEEAMQRISRTQERPKDQK